ncbi:2-hydroxyacid dehydrogenase [Cupriavidus basilensis]|uniref:2-hydroxyacid dehydrogenase n=1 Tax=Cupriavidus basilensis TaxID=68895 RepID=UPI00157B3608|nr:glyoxylate/hydroxypyruvate reductase A [Cupriavidus basilensis]NUA28472.1 glyoxylate/hydroxypyruvate reductase A [Cupriavidus basilensis]
MTLLYKADPERGAEWARLIAERAPEQAFRLWPDAGDPADVRFLAAWEPPPDIARTFPNLELVFSVGAGIDQFDFSVLPPSLPVVRMVEPGLAAGMVEYVTMAVLALHRQLTDYREQQQREQWRVRRNVPAARRRVGVMGLGELGKACLHALGAFGFERLGWSRSRHALDGVRCHAGDNELPAFLAETDILVCLLPLTGATQGILNGELFARLPRGASIVNVGRGGHLIESDLIAALDAGHLCAAVLDVCAEEPLPQGHALWRHPRIWLTPHVASMTQPETAVDVVLDNIRRHRAGEPLVGLVDRGRGY